MSATLAISMFALVYAEDGPKIQAANATVGRNLEVSARILLTQAAPPPGLTLTLTSDDPAKLLLAPEPDAKGSPSIVLRVMPASDRTPEFYLCGIGGSGTVTYTVSAAGIASAKGIVTLAPSGLVIAARSRVGVPNFATTTGARSTPITVYSALLDSSLHYVALQPVAGGVAVQARIASSNPSVGRLASAAVTIAGGSDNTTTQFEPLSAGSTALAVSGPPGFSTPVDISAVTAIVKMPGMAVTGDMNLGQDLQAAGTLSLGEPAGSAGVTVLLTSDDPSRLLLSATGTETGSATLRIQIPAGASSGSYYLQSLADSGTVTYTAEARGFLSRTATIRLAPSGVVIAGMSFPETGGPAEPGFVASLSRNRTTPLYVCMVQLDPVTKRSADVTVQPLRGGRSLDVAIQNSNPTVGTVTSSVTIRGGSSIANVPFSLLSEGETVVSVPTPPGFTKSSNASWVTVKVTP